MKLMSHITRLALAAPTIAFMGCASTPNYTHGPWRTEEIVLSPTHPTDTGIHLLRVSASGRVTVRFTDGQVQSAHVSEPLRDWRVIAVDKASRQVRLGIDVHD